MVESEKLYKLINSSEELSWEDIAWLELKSKQYPYFQSARVIIAKHYLKENHVLKSHKIHTASTYAIDRNILRKRLTEKELKKETTTTPIAIDESKTLDKPIVAIETPKVVEEEVTRTSTETPVEIVKQELITNHTSTKEKSREDLLKAVQDRLAELQKNKSTVLDEKLILTEKQIESKTDAVEISTVNEEIKESKLENKVPLKEEIVVTSEKITEPIVADLDFSEELTITAPISTSVESTNNESSYTPVTDFKADHAETNTKEPQTIKPIKDKELKEKKEAQDIKRKLKLAETKRKKAEQKQNDEQIKSEIEAQNKPDKLFYSRLGNELNVENSDSIDLLLNYLESQKDKKKIVEEISYDEIKEVKAKPEKTTESIIEKFIQNDPRISKPDPKAKAPSEDLSETKYSKTKFISENLAKIKAKQGYIKEAKEIYQELSLKYPEKRSYFTEQINKLK